MDAYQKSYKKLSIVIPAVMQQISICENRFGFEPEITAKLAKQRCRIFEVGISYNGRSYEEGKKIGWKDGFRALWCIVKYNLFPNAVGPIAAGRSKR